MCIQCQQEKVQAFMEGSPKLDALRAKAAVVSRKYFTEAYSILPIELLSLTNAQVQAYIDQYIDSVGWYKEEDPAPLAQVQMYEAGKKGGKVSQTLAEYAKADVDYSAKVVAKGGKITWDGNWEVVGAAATPKEGKINWMDWKGFAKVEAAVSNADAQYKYPVKGETFPYGTCKIDTGNLNVKLMNSYIEVLYKGPAEDVDLVEADILWWLKNRAMDNEDSLAYMQYVDQYEEFKQTLNAHLPVKDQYY